MRALVVVSGLSQTVRALIFEPKPTVDRRRETGRDDMRLKQCGSRRFPERLTRQKKKKYKIIYIILKIN